MDPARAICIVRVSQRDDDSGHSPEIQIRAATKLALDKGWRLDPSDLLDENIDEGGKIRKVSGHWDLSDRPKLRYAVEEVEAGRAKAIIAERSDRLFRNLDVQREVIHRVEAAGGKFETLQGGTLSHATAEAELMANMNGSVNQYVRRRSMENARSAVQLAIDEGRAPGRSLAPLGYLRTEESKLVPDPKMRRVVVEAFERRLKGSSVTEIREFLKSRGAKRSTHAITNMLKDRIYLGEIHFGSYVPNLQAHEAIIDRDVFDSVQVLRIPRGRKPKSDRLLARLGILCCSGCKGRMVVGAAKYNKNDVRVKYPIYRCGSEDCPRKVAISAEKIEDFVVAAMKTKLASARGRASTLAHAQEAREALTDAQANLDAAMRSFNAAGLMTERVAIEKLSTLRAARDAAREKVDALGRDRTELVVGIDDWDQFTLEERRDLVLAVVEHVEVRPGYGPDRVSIRLLGQ